MRIENSFDVPASPEAAWELLMDVPRIIPCMPGAKLDEVVGDDAWKATMQVKLGPIGLTFATNVRREEADETEHRVKLAADAREVRNRGNAKATIESSLTENGAGGGTHVDLVTDLALTGAVAQYGRGMIEDISSQLVESFAQCVQRQLTPEPEPEAEAETAQTMAAEPKPVPGLALFFGALSRALRKRIRIVVLAVVALGVLAWSRARGSRVSR
ncbi:MAG TPA: SRPBCC family protein [Gaiellaceae bacterium]|nr:SRPBCC family protein [Gaiellaceae bacterium]